MPLVITIHLAPALKPLHIKRRQGSKRRRRGVIIVSVATMGDDL